MGPQDLARLRIESFEDRSVPPGGAFVHPMALSGGVVAPDAEDGARAATVCLAGCVAACPEFGPWGGDAAEVTITNRTWFAVPFTLSNGSHAGSYHLEPAESACGRGLGGASITFHDGEGKSTLTLQSGQRYQFVERGGLFLLERTK